MANRNIIGDRYAYMIMCHNDFGQLCRLLELLDDARNDLYIHIDKKSRNIPYDMIRDSLKCARLFFVRRISITWGGYSYVRCYYILLKEALKTRHVYYHMLSGADLPLKTQDEIHDFFLKNAGKEFITFDYNSNRDGSMLDRIRNYHFFQDIVGRKEGKLYDGLRALEKKSLEIQNRHNVDRLSGEIRYYKGSGWFSVTERFARYVLSQKAQASRMFRYTLCPDEFLMQTLIMNSDHKKDLSPIRTRLIDWKRTENGSSSPHTFTMEDYETLIGSDRLFARKFDEKKDQEIILKICDYVRNRQAQQKQ